MDVAGRHPDPGHRGQMADGVRNLRVLNEFGLAGGARREVDQQRVVDLGHGGERPRRKRLIRVGVAVPTRYRIPHDDSDVLPVHGRELVRIGRIGHHEARPATGDPVGQIGRTQRPGRRHHHRAELGDRQHRLPQLDLVAQHDDDAVTLAHAQRPQPRRHLVGPVGHLREGVPLLVAAFFGDPQRRLPGPFGAARDDVEPVGGPVEGPGQPRPAERIDGLRVVTDRCHEAVPRRSVLLGVGGDPSVCRHERRIYVTPIRPLPPKEGTDRDHRPIPAAPARHRRGAR